MVTLKRKSLKGEEGRKRRPTIYLLIQNTPERLDDPDNGICEAEPGGLEGLQKPARSVTTASLGPERCATACECSVFQAFRAVF